MTSPCRAAVRRLTQAFDERGAGRPAGDQLEQIHVPRRKKKWCRGSALTASGSTEAMGVDERSRSCSR